MKLALKHIVATLIASCAVALHVLADNPDAPNLDFSHGNYDNWTLYVGKYEADAPTSDVYNYTWTQIDQTSSLITSDKRITLINSVDQNDPIVSCSDFYTNPFAGSIVTRIGVPLKTEGLLSSNNCQSRWNTHRAAASEKMTYTYTVTEGSSILRYDFAAVLNVPDNSNHSGEQLPYFGIKVEVNDAATGSSYVVPCGSYDTNANESTSSLLHNKPIEECRSSRAGSKAGNYVYRPWTNGTIDLRDYIGKSVTITINTHDCIVDCNNYNVAGGHESYAYFRASATSVGLQTSNCGIDDGIITAPTGYASYTWSRSDGLDATGIIYDPAHPNQITVPRSTIREGVVYKCVLSDEMGCAHIEITTKLDPVLLTPGFEYENHCGGEVQFNDNTTVEGDVVNRWQWDFGDGDYSFDRNPTHSYATVGDYDVKLIVQTEKGCSRSVTKKISVRFFPKLAITATSPICRGGEFMLSVTGAESGSTYKWFDDTSPVLSEQNIFATIATTSKTYYVQVTDPHNCMYQAQQAVTVQIPSVVTINGEDHVCPGSSVLLTAMGASTYEWDGMTETSAQISVSPATQKTYKVVGTDVIGCKSEAVHTVTPYERPEVTITGLDAICKGESTVWTLSGASTYYWSDSNNDSPRTVRVAKDYSVIGFDEHNCESLPVSKTLEENPLPEITVEGTLSACPNDNYVVGLVSSVSSTFSWDDGFTGASRKILATSDEIFTVTATSLNDCSSTTNISLRLLPEPYITISGTSEVCSGSATPAHLTAHGSDIESYIWSVGEESVSVDVFPAYTSDYWVEGTNSNGCHSRGEYTVKVNPLPNVTIEGETPVCPNVPTKLTAMGAQDYTWDNISLYSGERWVSINSDTVFTVTGTDVNGCKAKGSISMRTKNIPDVKILGDSLICFGTSDFVMQAVGADSYIWHNNSTSDMFTAHSDRQYSISVKGFADGCESDWVKTTLRVKENPKVSISGLNEVCQGSPVNLTASVISGNVQYKWLHGATEAEITVYPNSDASYSVTATMDNGCTDTAQHLIAVYDKPVVNLKSKDEICYGDTVHLRASGNARYYYWQGETVVEGTLNIVMPEETTTYDVKAISQEGCETFVSKRVIVNPSPQVSVDGEMEICQGESVLLFAKGADEFEWRESPDPEAPVVESSAYMDATLQNSETFYVTGKNAKCSTQVSVPVVVHPQPKLKLTHSTDAVCVGQSATLSVSGASSYKWLNTSFTGAELEVYPVITTLYRVVGYSEFLCASDMSEVLITVHPLPEVRIEGDLNVCYGAEAKLTAVGTGSSYQWSTGENGLSISPVVNNEMDITVTAFTEYGCERSAEHKVVPVLSPDLKFSGRTEGCVGDTLTIVGEGAATYLWPDGSTDPVYKMALEQTTNILLTGTLKNCTRSIIIPVKAYLSPTLAVTSDTVVCRNAEFKLSAAGAEQYKWNTGASGETVILSINAPTTYYVTGTTGGCSSTKKINVSLLPSPVLKMRLEDYGVCPYRDDSIMVSVAGAQRYEWYSQPENERLNSVHSSLLRTAIDGPAWIYAVGYNEYNCMSVDSLEIKELPEPKFSYTVEPTWIDKDNSEVRLTGLEPTEAASWYWNAGDGSSLIDGADVFHRYDVESMADELTVTVTAVDRHNCKFTAEVPIHVWKEIWAPTAFTPNGDGLNDEFRFFGGNNLEEFSFYIYNRLGEIVFEGRSIDDSWDGVYQGKLCPWGVYGYVANYKSMIDGLERAGEIRGKVSIVK